MKRLLAQKESEQLIKENEDFVKDYTELCHKVLMMKMMWGVNIGLILKDPDESPKGSGLGEGMVEDLTQLQNELQTKE